MPRLPNVERFEPDAALCERFRRMCTTTDGLLFADIRWAPEHGALAVWELRQDGVHWIVRETIRDGHGKPRQVDERDINAMSASLHEARNAHESGWFKREVEDVNARADAAAQKAFDDELADILKMEAEMKRRGYCWHGIRPEHCQDCATGRKMAELAAKRTGMKVSRRPDNATFGETMLPRNVGAIVDRRSA